MMDRLEAGKISLGNPIIPNNGVKISAGGEHVLIIKKDGSLWGGGYNGSGQLGDGTTANKNTLIQIIPGEVADVSAGSAHSLILKNNGQLWGTGQNQFGQLGDGTSFDKHIPIHITGNAWNSSNEWNQVSVVFNRDHNATHGMVHRYINGAHYDEVPMSAWRARWSEASYSSAPGRISIPANSSRGKLMISVSTTVL